MTIKLIAYIAFALALGIILGAFGAHALMPLLSPKQQVTFETAVKYWYYMHIALLGVAVLQIQLNVVFKSVYIIIIGTVIFCFALWLNALLGIKTFGALAPIGGLLMVAGWIWLCLQILKLKNKHA